MTSQTLVNDRPASVSSSSMVVKSVETSPAKPQSRLLEAMKSQYQIDQQVKFLHLQAEAESLLNQLQAIKQQRQSPIAIDTAID